MIKNTKKFLVVSFSILIFVCIVMFTITSVYVSGKSDGAINEVGKIYMSAIAKQMQEKSWRWRESYSGIRQRKWNMDRK